MIGFWFVYANILTTATSLKFEKPRFTFMWFIVYPMGILVGVAVLAWAGVHSRPVYGL